MEFKLADTPGLVFWPGFDSAFLNGAQTAPSLRERLGIAAEAKVLVYNGNIHKSNEAEVTSLILAAGILHRKDSSVRLLKTGTNYAGQEVLANAVKSGYCRDLGWIDRSDVSSLLNLADVLVQPGRPNRFNDYRFPSKLPEFLVSGKPVILPRSNVGRFLRDGVECVLLQQGDPIEIAEKIEALLVNPRLRASIGAAGKAFALARLDWSKNVESLAEFYRETVSRPAPLTVQTTASSSDEKPVKLIAFYLPQFHPIRKIISGGGRALPSGPMLRVPGLSILDTITTAPGGFGLLRPPASRGDGKAGAIGKTIWCLRILLLLLLVQRPPVAGNSTPTNA